MPVSIDPAKLTVPNLLKTLGSVDAKLDDLYADLDGIDIKIKNSKSLTEQEEAELFLRFDSIDANLERISAIRAAVYGTLLGRFQMDMNARPMLSRTASDRQSRSRRSKNNRKSRRARSV
jgi:hypothetical protein